MQHRAIGRARTALALCCLLLASGFASWAEASSPPHIQTRQWLLERTGTGLTTLDLDIAVVSVAADPAFFAVVALQSPGSSGGSAQLVLLLGARGEIVPTVYAGGAQYGCRTLGNPQPPHPCAAYGNGARFARLTQSEAERALPDAFLLATRGFQPRASLRTSARGWRLREVAPRLRYVRADESAVAGFGSLDASAEVFTGASAAGGSKGSVAVANPPCGNAVGTAVFAGGPKPITMTCPLAGAAASYSAATTRWTLDGQIVGSSTNPFRLLVIDLPPVHGKAPE